MKILVFGDVHGNLIALEELFRLEKGNYDRFVCHGDIVNYGPWTNECIEFLSYQENGIFLKGNHEEYYLEKYYPGSNEVAKSFFEFCYPQFNNKLLPVISKFEDSLSIGDFNIKHSIDGLYIFEDTNIEYLDFENNSIVGHSHQQFHRIIDDKNLYNTGSLGQNRALLDVANYLIIDTDTNNVELKSFIFDIQKVISKMEELKYPFICLNYYKSKNTVNK
ncbi:metallophosphoesterase [Chryseobacterium chendengshani]|uniref:metallophosphoesterase family protein n=1 Tax=Chryseobacterium sp. LJ668 TaxID=2864040 RepID=UPI001C6912D4|nr:metallophosphoesterase [Chryseobacterium sp. LJ668]MBW8523174.1 metallophosphoesterase [Chryseobacterium sp. LJ668]QYK15471.1 metallophosphoesterase [Chryseobacterium sp. LJ668]